MINAAEAREKLEESQDSAVQQTLAVIEKVVEAAIKENKDHVYITQYLSKNPAAEPVIRKLRALGYKVEHVEDRQSYDHILIW